jgi:hypothetical protein
MSSEAEEGGRCWRLLAHSAAAVLPAGPRPRPDTGRSPVVKEAPVRLLAHDRSRLRRRAGYHGDQAGRRNLTSASGSGERARPGPTG